MGFVQRLDVLPWSEMKDLIEQSYEMVAAKAKVGMQTPAKVRRPAQKEVPDGKENALENAYWKVRRHPGGVRWTSRLRGGRFRPTAASPASCGLASLRRLIDLTPTLPLG